MNWFLWLIPSLVVELVAWLLTPIVCLFVVKREHYDKVKRYGRSYVTLTREFLPDWLSYFATPDNALDEYWYGLYNTDSVFKFLREATELDYINHWHIRYLCRCLWLWRNTAMGWHYAWFSVPEEDPISVTERGIKCQGFWWKYTKRPSSFQFQYHIPIPFTSIFIDGNVGFKGHGFSKLMIANRVIGLRRYEIGKYA